MTEPDGTGFVEDGQLQLTGFTVVDLHLTDEDEICAGIDDVIDNDKWIAYTDSDDLDQANEPLAVLLPWSAYAKLTKAAHGIIPEA